jgi:REP element-mobilizing transposase RayT
MQLVFRVFFILLLLSSSGCQFHTRDHELPMSSDPEEQEQLYTLIMQGKRYRQFSELQQQAECVKLKYEYRIHSDWHTAWLLVYALNTKFNCLTPEQALDLLNTIQAKQNSSNLLLWLNENQIELLSNLDKFQKKSTNLRKQLKQTQKRLKKANSKIQALKAIEASINKKLGNEQSNQP